MSNGLATISSEVAAEVECRLREIEETENVRVVYAVESGSRAWGFPSRDSDYDVRFIYVHPTDWYLTFDLESKRDVIERPLTEGLDLSGWDIRKTLKLFAKSNPPLLEWLDSSIVYQDSLEFAAKLRACRAAFFSPQACAYHYLHMAQGNFRTYLHGQKVWVKKYFYVLRPLLAVRWIEQGRGIVPMLFVELLTTIAAQPDVIRDIQDLLKRKIAGDELDEGPSIPAIQEFITEELARLEGFAPDAVRARVDYDQLNQVFREVLRDAWA